MSQWPAVSGRFIERRMAKHAPAIGARHDDDAGAMAATLTDVSMGHLMTDCAGLGAASGATAGVLAATLSATVSVTWLGVPVAGPLAAALIGAAAGAAGGAAVGVLLHGCAATRLARRMRILRPPRRRGGTMLETRDCVS